MNTTTMQDSPVRPAAELMIAAILGLVLFEPTGNLVYMLAGHPPGLDTPAVNAAWLVTSMLLGALVWAYHRRWIPGSRAGGVIREALAPVADRWPTALALLITADQWFDSGPPVWLLLVIGLEHFLIGLTRRSFPNRRVMAWQAAGAAVYVAAVGYAMATNDATVSALILGLGWILHAGWDAILFGRDIVTWRWLCEACFVIDIAFGAVILATVV